MNMKKIAISSLVVLVMIIGVIIKYRSHTALQTPKAIWVQAAKVKETSLPFEAQALGTLVAQSVEITPELPGHISKIFFKDGSSVKQGDLLIQLDDSVYNAKLASAKAQLSYSENNFKRMILLGKQGAIAKQAIDQSDADLKEKRANAQENEVLVSKLKLTAPFDGVAGKVKVNPGDYVTVGQSLVTVTDVQHLRVEYNVPEKYLPQVKLGQEISLTTLAYPDKVFTGKVAFISPTINADNRSIALYADVPNTQNQLAPGMFVNVKQSLGTDDHVYTIPARSLVPILDGEQVYKIVEGKAYAVSVKIGKRFGQDVQVIQGLSPGDLVVTDGQLKVKNGVEVAVKS